MDGCCCLASSPSTVVEGWVMSMLTLSPIETIACTQCFYFQIVSIQVNASNRSTSWFAKSIQCISNGLQCLCFVFPLVLLIELIYSSCKTSAILACKHWTFFFPGCGDELRRPAGQKYVCKSNLSGLGSCETKPTNVFQTAWSFLSQCLAPGLEAL